jgi:putative two-component system response regulator
MDCPRHKILLIDDEPANLRLLRRVLGNEYDTLLAESGSEGISILQNEQVSLIITDQRMPGMTGVQVLQEAVQLQPQALRILLTGYTDIEALIDAINSGQIYKYVQKPWDSEDLKLTVRRAIESLELKQANDRLIVELKTALSQLENFSVGTIVSLANALDAKCDYTSGHSLRVSRYAVCIGRQLRLSNDELKDLELTGILHDIGKIGVPESILWKPGRLNEEEQKIMSIHPLKSAEMIQEIEQFERVRHWVKHHHEHLDGSGYPDGLAGDAIPLGARIVLVADAYDAMTSDRPYRNSIGYSRASAELRKFCGRQFDPQMVDALLSVLGENGEHISADGIPESFLGLKLGSIDPLQSGKQYLAESARKAQSQT